MCDISQGNADRQRMSHGGQIKMRMTIVVNQFSYSCLPQNY